MKEVYTIELDRPDGVSKKELVAYIKEAVEIWGGQKRPDDPLFYPWTMGTHKGKYPAIRVRGRYP